ncbi:MAG: ATP-dependent DNA helicase RecQ [Gemmatimonadota bacterium]|nr:MAG: ATP-dependent DNA helicase RecQ [Gemmatimonadota bacterium]
MTAPLRPGMASARSVLRRVWGYEDFRHHQRRAVLAALRGRDCLAVLPTGGGKSLCYQVPAMVLPGLTIVVSPLISLMQDQVAALRRRGVAAAYLSSTQPRSVQSAVWTALRSGHVRVLYLAPERLAQLAARSGREVSLLAVDEAHCISEWGHDFRPHYRALGRYRQMLGRPPTMALTATATRSARDDVVRVLGLRRPVRIVRAFDRANLYFAARRCGTEPERLRALAALLRGCPASTVVYVPTRSRADGVAAVLGRWGFSALPYHAGLPGPERRALLEQFLRGQVTVMVATNAFGLGIDKPDVRLVAHLGIPPRPEAYFQEAGRAGRDGKPARCVMLWLPADLVLARHLAGLDAPVGAREGATVRQARLAGLRAMQRYVETRGCRRRVLLHYLGERGGRCAGCDRCGCQGDR